MEFEEATRDALLMLASAPAADGESWGHDTIVDFNGAYDAILTAHRAEVERERREFVSKGLPEKHEHWVCSGCEAQLDTAKGEREK